MKQTAEIDLLVILAQEADEEAFRQLVEHFQKGLLRYAYSICRDAELSQDAVQEAWLAITGHLRRINDPRRFRSYLFRLVHWRAVDVFRKMKKQADHEQLFNDDMEHETQPVTSELHQNLSAAIARLPPLERRMIHLFYLEELHIDEIAGVLGIPAGTVKSRLNRARKLLRQRYREEP